MPIYEYVCEEAGKKPQVIELLRSAADADAPVADPDGKGRVFRRRLSTFAAGSGGSTAGATSGGHVHGGSCGCGKPRGSCGL